MQEGAEVPRGREAMTRIRWAIVGMAFLGTTINYVVSGPITDGTGRFAGATGFLTWRGFGDLAIGQLGDTITGTIRPPDVVGPAGQGIAAGEFGELVRAIRAGVTYANVHTAPFPAGEIRGQID